MKVKEVIAALEQFAPLPLQDDFDNSGLQIGLTEADVTGALLCLDVTEEVIAEAAAKGLNLVVAHHPLLFHPLKAVVGRTFVERCTIQAVRQGIAVYAAHTSLDNAVGGVNYEIARRIGLTDVELLTHKDVGALEGGAGVVGALAEPADEASFLTLLKERFSVSALRHNRLTGRSIRRVALCGGAGAFLLRDAIRAGSDCFITGEIHYHDYFGHDDEILMVEMGHYESEQFTPCLLQRLLKERFPKLRAELTELNTNPIQTL
ncbi:MAG: Nif3-like dinuclear metal center hexameric protein [Bacteroidaceae bacterium]|nr:Nif3-like dinuclear metal center hexameric protein [Bacteroidaceae bacterium]